MKEILAIGVGPAFLDPAFAGEGLDPGYLATRPGTRYELLHAPGDVDPAVIAEDEATKDVVSTVAFADGMLSTLQPYSAAIDVPCSSRSAALTRSFAVGRWAPIAAPPARCLMMSAGGTRARRAWTRS